MAAVAGGLLYAGGISFALFVAALGVITCFEWARIVRGQGVDAALAVQVVAVIIAAALVWQGLAALAVAAVIAGAILTGLLSFDRHPLLSAEGCFMPDCRSWP